MLCNEEYLCFKHANSTEATPEATPEASLYLIFGIPVHFDDALCHSVTHPVVFNIFMTTKMET